MEEFGGAQNPPGTFGRKPRTGPIAAVAIKGEIKNNCTCEIGKNVILRCSTFSLNYGSICFF